MDDTNLVVDTFHEAQRNLVLLVAMSLNAVPMDVYHPCESLESFQPFHKRPEQTITAWRTYREATKPGSDNWLAATASLAHELREAGQHRSAIKLVSEYLATDKTAFWLMLDAAESHIALGEDDQARAMISQAEAASRDLKKSTNKIDIRILARIDERMKSLRKQLDKKKPQ